MSDDPHIGTLSEHSLHAALKEYYAQPGDLFEQRVDGYVIDILRNDQLLEIQTKNFTAIRRKLNKLLKTYRVHLIHPIASNRWIIRLGKDGVTVRTRRKSPKHGTVYDLFYELVRIPAVLDHPNLSLEVAIIHDEVLLINDGQGSWRRKGWSIHDRRLLEVVDQHKFSSPADLLTLIPADIPPQFTNQQLASALDISVRVIQKMTYTLRKMELLDLVGKQGRAYLFSING